MRKTRTLDADYFDGLYRNAPDPWGFETEPYEAAKYDDTLAALGREGAAAALEVGCSIGVLTRRLAPLCARLVATELSATALARARARCADLTQVEFRLARSLTEGFEGRYDLIILSEVVYYWDAADLERVAAALKGALLAGGRLLLVHWLGETDYPRSGDDAVCALADHLGELVQVELRERRPQYRLDLWRRVGKAS
jgi:SAM-dependent methyltransferase